VVGEFAGLQRLAAVVALACSLLVSASDAWAGSPKNYTPAVVADVFRDAGIELDVTTVSGEGADAYTWLRPRMTCKDTSNPACAPQLVQWLNFFVAVCPSAHAAAWVVSGTSKRWHTATIRNVVVAYRPTPQGQRPRHLGLAIARLTGSRPEA
jgi:hypothetical protein